ncbi:DUF6563 family protein [Fibrivirga algicola]|uniref:Uncharacterized protein n=1 Tax=Fibrivirga algicola TaxID=2950420 RepID=A0ABX0QDS0_9BACT|nr:DUF6563 family protein [Fibrivirga algicola]NID10569.1 hypothetical protein [Fibrivirga algicola]
MRRLLYTLTLATLFLSVTCATSAVAQTGFKLNLPLAKMPDISPDRLFFIDSVYATFPDTACIGKVYRAGLAEVAKAYVKDGLSSNMSASIFSHFPQLKDQHRPVRLRVDGFSYVEDPIQGNNFDANLTFLRADSLLGYVPFYTAILDVEVSGMGRGSRILDELLRAIKGMNTYLNNPTKEPPYLSDYEVKMKKAAVDMKMDSSRYGDRTSEDNLLTCQKRRPGIYLTETDLIMNRPALLGDLAVERRDDFATLLRPNKRRAQYRFFGFSDGQDVYINSNLYGGQRARYARVLEVGRYLLWRDDFVTLNELTNRAAAASAGGIAGGFIGGFVGGLVGAASTSRRDCIAVDVQTGKLVYVTSGVLKRILADQPALLAEYEAAGKPRKSDVIYEYMVRYNQGAMAR